jgi:3',5'-cyclic-nucleotide phosphodiesterase
MSTMRVGHAAIVVRGRSGLAPMKLQILGCAGGIGGHQRFTTCMLVDHDILLDAGTGITNLDIDQLAAIDHVFLTHCHLDHVAGLALLVDAVRGKRNGPVTVHASEDVISSLKKYLFNWVLWPDFAVIPSAEEPTLAWAPFTPGATLKIDGRLVSSFPVRHTPGAVAYWVHNERDGFLFSGDMCSTPEMWAHLAKQPDLSKAIIDCSFPNAERELADISMHFCPRTLLGDIEHMPHSIEFLIYHLKPGQEDQIMNELKADGGDRNFRALKTGDIFTF